jgi:hypothetical protein
VPGGACAFGFLAMEVNLILAADLPHQLGQPGGENSHPSVFIRPCVFVLAHIESVLVPGVIIEDLRSAFWQMLLG